MVVDTEFDTFDVNDDLLADLDRAETHLVVRVERRRYGKPMTIVEGFTADGDLGTLASTLKRALGAGGSVVDGRIEVQGDHRDRMPALLEAEGFTVA